MKWGFSIVLALVLLAFSVSAQVNTTTTTSINGTFTPSQVNPIQSSPAPSGFEFTPEFPYTVRPTGIRTLLSTQDKLYAGTDGYAILYLDIFNPQNIWQFIPGSNHLFSRDVNILYQLSNGTIVTGGYDSGRSDRMYAMNPDLSGWHEFARLPDATNLQSFIQTNDGTLIVGNAGHGSYVSKDRAKTWQLLPFAGVVLDIIQASNGNIYAINTPQLMKSQDGINWQGLSMPYPAIRTIIETSDHVLLVGTEYGVIGRSRDFGESISWTETNIGEVIHQFYRTSNGKIYVGTANGLWRNIDNTYLSWEKLFASGPIYAMEEGSDGKLYVGAYSFDVAKPILRSTFLVTPVTTTSSTSTTSTTITTTTSTSITTTTIKEYYTPEQVDALLAARDARILALETQLNSLLGDFNTQDSRIDELDNRLFTLESFVDELNSDIVSLRNKISNIMSMLNKLPDGLKRLMGLETTTTTVTTTIAPTAQSSNLTQEEVTTTKVFYPVEE